MRGPKATRPRRFPATESSHLPGRISIASLNPLLLTCREQRERDHGLCPDHWQTFDQLIFVDADARPQPRHSRRRRDDAIIILNVPWPYAGGPDYPGGSFGIEVDGKLSPVIAGFTYNKIDGNARVPTTLVVGVPLGNKEQTITAVWQNVRGSNVTIDTPASLTSIMN